MICPVFVARDVSGFRTARKGGGEWARQECCKGYGRCVSRDCSSGMSGTSCYREKRHLRRGRNSRRVIRSLIRSAEKHHAGREYAPSHFANHSSAFGLQVRSPYPDMRLFLSEGASRIRSSSASTPRRGGSHGATRRPMALHSGDRLGHLRGRRAGFGVPLRRDPPSGRDLDDGTVSQLLEELRWRGTGSSNPSPSSGGSCANLTFADESAHVASSSRRSSSGETQEVKASADVLDASRLTLNLGCS